MEILLEIAGLAHYVAVAAAVVFLGVIVVGAVIDMVRIRVHDEGLADSASVRESVESKAV
jgi:hypothetical protein